MVWYLDDFKKDIHVPLVEYFGEDIYIRFFYAFTLSFIIAYGFMMLYWIIHMTRLWFNYTYRTDYARQHTRRMWLYKVSGLLEANADTEKSIEREARDLEQNIHWYHYFLPPDLGLVIINDLKP